MVYLLYGLYILACLFLVLVVLLQSGKGGDVAAAFGGAGSQTAFGPRGAQKPLEKATIIAAIIFMLLALIFSLPGITGPRSVVRESGATATPSPSPAASLPAAAPSVSPTAAPSASPSPSASASPAAKTSPSPAKK
ncbi:MAG TPA: preprotein translocase subunit SecG [Blastocatellia bacterium]|nr:preprotein translocase subunit SecG [Blastocatellia bacterium]